MKYSTAKRFVKRYRRSVYQRGQDLDRSKLRRALQQFEAGLKHNGLQGQL